LGLEPAPKLRLRQLLFLLPIVPTRDDAQQIERLR
jgi:hypothetical protein